MRIPSVFTLFVLYRCRRLPLIASDDPEIRLILLDQWNNTVCCTEPMIYQILFFLLPLLNHSLNFIIPVNLKISPAESGRRSQAHRNGTNMNPAPTMKSDKCHFRYITFVMKTRSSDARYGGS